MKQLTVQEPRKSWLAAANEGFSIAPPEPVWCAHSADPRCPRPSYGSRPSWLVGKIRRRASLTQTSPHPPGLLFSQPAMARASRHSRSIPRESPCLSNSVHSMGELPCCSRRSAGAQGRRVVEQFYLCCRSVCDRRSRARPISLGCSGL
jgi:hypothetical protein